MAESIEEKGFLSFSEGDRKKFQELSAQPPTNAQPEMNSSAAFLMIRDRTSLI